jgi:amino acid adenylation domain-containing protein/thioester reductase-like protein
MNTEASELLLHELFARQAEATPRARAATCRDAELSYSELDQWSNRLARRLVSAGAGPETRVAIIAERCLETIVAQLATLKAGAAYVPIDPAYPPARFHYLMRDCGAQLVVCPERLRGSTPEGDWTVVLSDRDYVTDLDSGPLGRLAQPDNAAYVIYTSGSTGQPKGVVVTQRGIASASYGLTELGRPDPASFLLLISFSFDASAVGLYWTLVTGGEVIVPTAEAMRDVASLRDLAFRHRVTHLDCTPALYSLILGDDPAPLRTLRCAIVGGEACPRDLVEHHHQLLPECLLVNNYGPTEATVWATSCTLTGDEPGAVVPIGRPAPRTRAYVLDDQARPLPAGAIGELFIGGAGVARGYHCRPALTADRFLPDALAPEAGARMYRTGDRARRLADDRLEFCGRSDHQVKVRGFRIELGEVEQALMSHPDVTEAVADVRDMGGTSVLAAWVGAADAVPDPERLRTYLARALPSQMVPSRLVFVDQLPRNVAGKVDRTELMLPDEPAGPHNGRPLTPTESEVAELVTEVIGVASAPPDVSVFDLGATSLHLSRLLLAIWSRFGVTVMMHNLFDLPTVAGIARMVELGRSREITGPTQTWTFEQLAAACTLDEAINADGLRAARWHEPRNIFVTGATGYLGAFLVRELADRTDATIWCLVRTGSAGDGLTRIVEAMKRYLIWDDSLTDRLRPVCGDLGEPRFGLGPDGFDALAKNIDVIVHCGALVNVLYPYSELKPPNVDGTQEVLRLAATVTLKAVHFVSTIDVYTSTKQDRPFLEDHVVVPRYVPEGYARSKVVAEELVKIARERGVPCSIYRPGLMLSHTRTGATQLNDFLLIEIKSLLGFGVVPDVHYMFDAVPIDYPAAAITHIAFKPECLGGNYNLWNPKPVGVERIFDWIRSFGYTFEPTSFDVVTQHLATVDTSDPIFPLIPLFFDEENRVMPDTFQPEVMARTDLPAESANTRRALADSGIACPPLSEDLAHRCLQYLVDVGFFPRPDEQQEHIRARSVASAAG